MASSNFRVKDYETVHHLTSRIAHRVYFLEEDERNDLVDIVRRSAQFCGVKLLAWCVMTNHFHLLVYLPQREIPGEEEILSRYAILKGAAASKQMETQLSDWRSKGDFGQKQADEWLDRQRARMYDVGEFMKLVKQWLTEEYNRRHSHVGTLWEAAYYDRVVSYRESAIARCAGYIHLNPIRAAICASYTEYPWSSLTAFAKGDRMAIDGMRFIYSAPEANVADLLSRHSALMDDLLENEKRRRAIEIARKRLAGYEAPCDPLTTEAMIAQAQAHCKMVIRAGVQMAEEEGAYRKCTEKRSEVEHQLISAMRENPNVSVDEMAKLTDLPKSTVYRYLKGLKQRAIISRFSKNAPWSVLTFSN